MNLVTLKKEEVVTGVIVTLTVYQAQQLRRSLCRLSGDEGRATYELYAALRPIMSLPS